jgi:hypothetical protein
MGILQWINIPFEIYIKVLKINGKIKVFTHTKNCFIYCQFFMGILSWEIYNKIDIVSFRYNYSVKEN